MEKHLKKSAPFIITCASFGVGLVACQPQAKPMASARPAAVPTEVEDSQFSIVVTPLENPHAFLAANNLAPLWRSDFGDGSLRPVILEGFYGAEYRHISFVLDQVAQAANQPGQFQVHGRTRYQKRTTPFDGTITIRKVERLNFYTKYDTSGVGLKPGQAYATTADFKFRAVAPATEAGTYEGKAQLNFCRLPSGKLDSFQALTKCALPVSDSLVFRGHWKSQHTGRWQQVAFATSVLDVAPAALRPLLGERGATIDPKYAHSVWEEIWENEEWWNTSPKPSL